MMIVVEAMAAIIEIVGVISVVRRFLGCTYVCVVFIEKADTIAGSRTRYINRFVENNFNPIGRICTSTGKCFPILDSGKRGLGMQVR
jgi:hypothetical protein